MSSFLFNVALILATQIRYIHGRSFAFFAFPAEYTSSTTILVFSRNDIYRLVSVVWFAVSFNSALKPSRFMRKPRPSSKSLGTTWKA